jgi:hypothetical protein
MLLDGDQSVTSDLHTSEKEQRRKRREDIVCYGISEFSGLILARIIQNQQLYDFLKNRS